MIFNLRLVFMSCKSCGTAVLQAEDTKSRLAGWCKSTDINQFLS